MKSLTISLTNIYAVLLLAGFVSFPSFTQTENQARKVLKDVSRFDQVDSLKSAHPKWSVFSEILSDIDTTKYPAIKNPVLGEIRKMTLEKLGATNFMFKIVEFDVDRMCRSLYIYLDGEKYNSTQLDSMGRQITYRYQRGEDFMDLHAEFNMDGADGETGWFNLEMVMPAFFEAVFNQYKGSVFPVKVPDVNGLFVVLKTHENIVRNLYKTVWIGYEE